MSHITDLFFDLDRTLWDFDKNSAESLTEIFDALGLPEKGIASFHDFHERYSKHNLRLWELYKQNEIEKEELNYQRFALPLSEFGVTDTRVAMAMTESYVEKLGNKTGTFQGVLPMLRELSSIFRLHVITNGFEEIQYRKIRVSGMNEYFSTITTSEEAGFKKPELRIFRYALLKAGAEAASSVMIGDDPETDLDGARKAGMMQMYVNLDGSTKKAVCDWEVKSIAEISPVLKAARQGA